MSRHKHTRTTTERGLGYAHKVARADALAALADGTPCPRCHRPMYRDQARALDLDHIDTPRALGGQAGTGVLAHARCNRQAGARLGVRLRAAARSQTRQQTTRRRIHSRQW